MSDSEVKKHTPGPWKLEYDDGDNAGVFTLRMGTAIKNRGMYKPNHLIEIYEGTWPEYVDFPETEANARLIAAAPELLEALEQGADLTLRLLTMVTHGKPSEEDAKAWLNFAGAVIRKAKGG
jgi:hypothetical protein